MVNIDIASDPSDVLGGLWHTCCYVCVYVRKQRWVLFRGVWGNTLFSEHVKCTTHGCSFSRARYILFYSVKFHSLCWIFTALKHNARLSMLLWSWYFEQRLLAMMCVIAISTQLLYHWQLSSSPILQELLETVCMSISSWARLRRQWAARLGMWRLAKLWEENVSWIMSCKNCWRFRIQLVSSFRTHILIRIQKCWQQVVATFDLLTIAIKHYNLLTCSLLLDTMYLPDLENQLFDGLPTLSTHPTIL